MRYLDRFASPADMPEKIPVFPLSGALLLPRIDLPLNIFENRYLEMFDDALSGNRIVGMIQPRDGDQTPSPKLADVGCAGRITSYSETPDGRLLVSLTGLSRFRVAAESKVRKPYRVVTADYAPFAIDFVAAKGDMMVNRTDVLKAFRAYLEANNMTTNWEDVETIDTEQLVNTLSLMAPYPPQDKQALLEAKDLKARAEMLVALTELALARQGAGKNRNLQ
jgi:uncharacterized protein